MGFEQLAALRDQLAAQARQEQRSDRPPRQERAGKPARGRAAEGDAARPAAPRGGKPGRQAGQDRPARTGQQAGRREQPPREPVDPVVLTIARLQKQFPAAFPRKPADKVALKLGIHQDLVAQSNALGLNAVQIKDAIKTWCEGSRYWAALVENAPRIGLDGQPNGVVTAAEALRARQLAGRRQREAIRARRAADKAAAPAGDATPAPTGEPAHADGVPAITAVPDAGTAGIAPADAVVIQADPAPAGAAAAEPAAEAAAPAPQADAAPVAPGGDTAVPDAPPPAAD